MPALDACEEEVPDLDACEEEVPALDACEEEVPALDACEEEVPNNCSNHHCNLQSRDKFTSSK